MVTTEPRPNHVVCRWKEKKERNEEGVGGDILTPLWLCQPSRIKMWGKEVLCGAGGAVHWVIPGGQGTVGAPTSSPNGYSTARGQDCPCHSGSKTND